MDPTRTTLLRDAFVREMIRRMRAVAEGVVAFLLPDYTGAAPPKELKFRPRVTMVTNAPYRFSTEAAAVDAFRDHLKLLVDTHLLEAESTEAPWTSKYIDSAYKKGLKRGYFDSRNLEGPAKYDPGRTTAQSLDATFGSAESTKKLELLGTRAYNNLKGMSDETGRQLNQVMVEGMANGQAPSVIARDMVDKVEGMTRGRAATIARTEVIHAHAEGQLDAFEEAGMRDVVVMAEWSTAGDSKVCSKCSSLEGVVMTVKEARGLLPRHPNCRCAWLPAAVGEDMTGQVWDNASREAAIRDSVGQDTKDETDAGLARSRWQGADLTRLQDITGAKPEKSIRQELQEAKDTKGDKQKKLDSAAARKLAQALKLLKKQQATAIGYFKKAGLTVTDDDFDSKGRLKAEALARILTGADGRLLVAPDDLVSLMNLSGTPGQQAQRLLKLRATVLQAGPPQPPGLPLDLFKRNALIDEALLQLRRGDLDKPVDGLTQSEAAALRAYTSNLAYKVNDFVRKGHAPYADMTEFLGQMDSALGKLPKDKGTFFRGHDLYSDFGRMINELPEGGVFYERAYASFTDTYEGAKTHGKAVIEFVGRLPSVGNASAVPGEREYIAPRGTMFTKVGTYKKGDTTVVQVKLTSEAAIPEHKVTPLSADKKSPTYVLDILDHHPTLNQIHSMVLNMETDIVAARRAAEKEHEEAKRLWEDYSTKAVATTNKKKQKELFDLADKEWERAIGARDLAKKLSTDAASVIHDELAGTLNGAPVHLSITPSGKLSETYTARQAIAKEFLTKVTASRPQGREFFGKPLPDGVILDAKEEIAVRAHHSGDETGGYVKLSPDDSVSVHAHEVGHAIEKQNGLFNASEAFRRARITAAGTEDVEMIQAMPGWGYDPGEIGNEDGWRALYGDSDSGRNSALYTGKGYRASTEIISMGLEELYRDPVGFAKKDPQFFKYIVGVLGGHL